MPASLLVILKAKKCCNSPNNFNVLKHFARNCFFSFCVDNETKSDQVGPARAWVVFVPVPVCLCVCACFFFV